MFSGLFNEAHATRGNIGTTRFPFESLIPHILSGVNDR